MIDAKDAKAQLNCDDATLNNHINSGNIRAQKQGGKLLVNREDVERLAKENGDDGTIVLTGDSDELSIDLGKVVDDASETIVQPQARKKDKDTGSDSITFGEELEVVSFEDQSKGDQHKEPAPNFTDSNTAVMSSVDETQADAGTAPVDYSEQQQPASSRRSVRSNRSAEDQAPVHWMFPAMMAASLVVGLFFITPYYFMAMMPTGEKDAAGNVRRGAVDNGYTNMASSMAGFTVEPSKDDFIKKGGEAANYVDISMEKDPQAKWRFEQYTGTKTKSGERAKDFIITEVDSVGKKAKTATGKEYSVSEKKTGEVAEFSVDLALSPNAK